MRKLLIVVMAFFIITGVVAGIYSFKYDGINKESNISKSDDDWYPENLRPIVETKEDGDSDIQEPENKEEAELVPDENFEEFEIEDETEDETEDEPEEIKPENNTTNPVETKPEENVIKPEEEKPEEAVTENTPVDTPVAAGSQIEISDYRVRLRAFPSEDSPVLAICKEGETGTLAEYGEDWSVIRIGGREGYIHNGLWKAK